MKTQRITNIIAILCATSATLITIGFGQIASAAPIIDGTFSNGEWGTPVKTYTNDADGANSVSLYWDFDSTNVYGAIKLNSGDKQFPSSNIYVYSNNADTNSDTGQMGTYGDGNDVLIEGLNQWSFGHPSPPYTSDSQSFTDNNDGTYSAGGVTVAQLSNTSSVEEFSINRNILGNYSSFHFGGQLFAYDFHLGTDAAVVAVDPAASEVPEPSPPGLLALGGFMIALGLTWRRRQSV